MTPVKALHIMVKTAVKVDGFNEKLYSYHICPDGCWVAVEHYTDDEERIQRYAPHGHEVIVTMI